MGVVRHVQQDTTNAFSDANSGQSSPAPHTTLIGTVRHTHQQATHTNSEDEQQHDPHAHQYKLLTLDFTANPPHLDGRGEARSEHVRGELRVLRQHLVRPACGQ